MNSVNRKRLAGWLNICRSVLILLMICVFATILSPDFLSVANLFNMFEQTIAAGVVGYGMAFVILTGGIDLSVSSILELVGVLTSGILESTGNAGVAIPAALAVGIGRGAVSDFFVAVCEIPLFISALGTTTLLCGCIFVYTKGSPIPTKMDSHKFSGKEIAAGVPVPATILTVLFLIIHYVLIQTSYGRSTYVFGDNREAVRLSDISVRLIEWMAYMFNGPMCDAVGVTLIARLGSAQSANGTSIEMDAIAAITLGGTSLSGGVGFMLPTMVGATTMGIIDNILTLMNVNPHATNIVESAVISIAVLIDEKAKDLSVKAEQQIEDRANTKQCKCRTIKPKNGRRE